MIRVVQNTSIVLSLRILHRPMVNIRVGPDSFLAGYRILDVRLFFFLLYELLQTYFTIVPRISEIMDFNILIFGILPDIENGQISGPTEYPAQP